MRAITDNPITKSKDDQFGFTPYALALAQIIANTKQLPFTIGIFGAWGSGKTSLMHLIKDEMQKLNPENKQIWFNPWKYDKQEDLRHAFIQTILYEIVRLAAPHSDSIKISTKAQEIAKKTSWIAFRKITSYFSAGLVSEKNLNTIKQIIEEDDQLYHRHINDFEEDFAKVVDMLVDDNGKLIIFIDDLDRCLPENAITVLEAIKLFIGNAKCVFVIGMDYYIVEKGIQVRYKEKLTLSGRDYLDKIIQLPFFIPPVPFEYLDDYFKKNTNFSEGVWGLVRAGIGSHLRKVKQFVNSLILITNVIHQVSEFRQSNSLPDHLKFYGQKISLEQENLIVAKLLIFQIMFYDFFELLRSEPNSWKTVEGEYWGKEGSEVQKLSKPELRLMEVWLDNIRLQYFINNTKEVCPAPDNEVISRLIRAISLVRTKTEKK